MAICFTSQYVDYETKINKNYYVRTLNPTDAFCDIRNDSNETKYVYLFMHTAYGTYSYHLYCKDIEQLDKLLVFVKKSMVTSNLVTVYINDLNNSNSTSVNYEIVKMTLETNGGEGENYTEINFNDNNVIVENDK